MTTDQLTAEQKEGARACSSATAAAGASAWPSSPGATTCSPSPGRFGWDGGYGTSGYPDPAEDLIGILLTQRMMDSPVPPKVFRDFWTSAYEAIDD